MVRRSWRAARTALGVVAAGAGVLLVSGGLGAAVAAWNVATWRAAGPQEVAGRLLTRGVAAALAALAVGFLLAVPPLRALWRAAGRRTRPWAARGGLAAAAAVVLLLGVLPVGGAAASLWPPRGLVTGPSPAAQGLAGADVSFTTSDGVRLAGWYAPSANGAAVVLVPGSYGTRSGVLDRAVVLARHGYGVLLLDPRGNGASGGRGMGYGWFLERDVAAAVGFVLGRPDVRDGRVGLLGVSLGGEGTLGAAGADPRVRAVVAEGVTNRGPADLGPLRGDGVRGRVVAAGYAVMFAVLDRLSDAPRPPSLAASVVATSPRPVLLVAGGTQRWEVRAADDVHRRALAAAPDARVEVWVVPDGAHAAALAEQPREWERRVVALFDTALAG
ncbi:alpha/beta hydrolase [Kineosporia sp. A_224]|uniref:alpha/beta hydrolase n=1 Tax=Kineosporia sp. A_224 TaxID=1962180 RepID=UPI000B4B7886|nr:CocE/NonD family hydrolase [Kineosporia sp. A_224]